MKLLTTILLGATLLLLSSCGSDSFSEEIVGTWELQSYAVTGCDDSDENISTINVNDEGCLNLIIFDICDARVTFNEDGTGIGSSTEDGEAESDAFTYTTNDDTETGQLCIDSDCTSISIDGDELTQTQEADDGCMIVAVYAKS